jgi:alkylated DNA nucleotide flippase Atl1
MQPDSHNAPKKSGAWFVVLGLVLISLFLLAALTLRGGAEATIDPEEIERDAFRTKTYEEVTAEESQKLTTYGWVDQAAGTVRIPIDVAMKRVLSDLNSKKPAPAYPVVDNAGNPIPPSTLPVPADAPPLTPADPDALPDASSSGAETANVLSAPVEDSAPKSAKNKKTPKAQ